MDYTYEVSACKHDGDCIVSGVPEAEAKFWTVYRRFPDGLAEALYDYMTREGAETCRDRLARRATMPKNASVKRRYYGDRNLPNG